MPVYETSFKLDKPHFQECFDQSKNQQSNFKSWLKPLIFIVIGVVIHQISADRMLTYLANFFIFLSLIEVLSIIFARSWWVTRQMLSRVSNSMIELRIDDEGILIKSPYSQNQLLWHQISDVESTEKGLLLHLDNKGRQYLSKSCLSEQAYDFIRQQSAKEGS
ncbi:YcxB family protein [Thalassotalea aquiviva]|uniref:YcxB family protein n=1 Tax=Thalassotalea aquiviva TaxID=3242415 RepID=UPI00352B04F0